MSTQDTLRGTIKSILYKNDVEGFIICTLQINDNRTETIKGYIPHVTKGELISAQGSWEIHKKFGKQFVVSSFQKITPSSKEGLINYLGSGLIKGIGPVYAQKLVDLFSTRVLDIIEHEPEKLLMINGIGKARQELICTSFKEQKEISHIMVFLQDKGISSTYALKIFKTYGKNAINVIEENPYQLAEDVWGIGFKLADEIAQKLGIAKNSLVRVCAAILHIISTIQGHGSVYYNSEKIIIDLCDLLQLPTTEIENEIQQSLSLLQNQGKVKTIFYNEQRFLTTPYFYYAEKDLSAFIKNLLHSPRKTIPIHDQQDLYKIVHFPLHEKQFDGLLKALSSGISIITGGPGTGKTTVIRSLLAALDAHNITYGLAAPTGRAAKRMMESTGREAVTIHRLLDFDPETKKFKKNEQSPIKQDFIIIDEASMLDVVLAHALLRAIRPESRILFIGDIDQLPSVGAGNVLYDMIESNIIPCTRLTMIFRQHEQSMIVLNAHRINNGKFPLVASEKVKPEFLFIEENDANHIPDHLKTIFHITLPQYDITPDQVMVLTPMHRGTAGTATLNMYLQNLLNDNNEKKIISSFGTTYKIGDRVMQLRNNYDKAVFNGDIGIIDAISQESGEIAIRFLDRIVLYDTHETQELMLAYATSIHKSQGSEYPAVIVITLMQHFRMLQKNLLYTALTRAKKLCLFIGEKRAIHIALKNTKNSERITFLKQYLLNEIC